MNGTLGGDYPDSWDGFVGQEQAKRQLMVATRSAKTRGVPLDHVLLASGTPGIGKTSLALLTAKEMGTELKVVSGRISANQARIMLSGMDDGDILCYDEIHQAVAGGKANAEWMLHLLQDGVIMGPRGPERQPKVTVVGATTDAGRLPETICQRFVLQPVLHPYSDDEAARIVGKLAHRLWPAEMPRPDKETALAIARAASNNPRTMRSILVNLRDLTLVDGPLGADPGEGTYELTEALSWLGLTPDGLNDTCQRYLVILLEEFAGAAGERALMDRLQEPGGLGLVERMLMDKGYLAKTRVGRQLTQTGIRRARQLQKEAK